MMRNDASVMLIFVLAVPTKTGLQDFASRF
jgi:hypothetical protein